jgi:hypothetical protein
MEAFQLKQLKRNNNKMLKPYNRPNAVYIGEKLKDNGFNGHKILVSVWEDNGEILHVWDISGMYYIDKRREINEEN